MKKLMLFLCLSGLSSCYKNYVISEGHFCLTLNNHQIKISKNIKGQIYRDSDVADAYKKHRYILQNLSDENIRINFQLQSASATQTVLDFDSSGLSTIKISDNSQLSGFRIYQSTGGYLTIHQLTKEKLEGSFYFTGVNKNNKNDTLKIEDGRFEISNPEFYNAVVP